MTCHTFIFIESTIKRRGFFIYHILKKNILNYESQKRNFYVSSCIISNVWLHAKLKVVVMVQLEVVYIGPLIFSLSELKLWKKEKNELRRRFDVLSVEELHQTILNLVVKKETV